MGSRLKWAQNYIGKKSHKGIGSRSKVHFTSLTNRSHLFCLWWFYDDNLVLKNIIFDSSDFLCCIFIVVFVFLPVLFIWSSSFVLNSPSNGFHPPPASQPDMLQPTPPLVSFSHRTSPWSERCYDDPNIWTSVRVDRRGAGDIPVSLLGPNAGDIHLSTGDVNTQALTECELDH